MSFSLKDKALHFSTADLNTLNKGLHPAALSPSTHSGNRDGEMKQPRGRVKPELAPAWAGLACHLLYSSCSPPSPCIPVRLTLAVSTAFGRVCWAGAGSPFPRDRYLLSRSSPGTIFAGARLRCAAGGPSGAGARASGGSRSHTLLLGMIGGGERSSDPRQDAPCPRGLQMTV